MSGSENGNARRAPGAFHKTENQHRENTPTRRDVQSPGAIGMDQWARMIGTPAAAPLYALIDRRRDGRPRIVSEHRDPEAARVAADVLRAAGDACEIVLITSIEAPA